MEMLIYKLPLIVIVVSPKWHSKCAMWPWEFQICCYYGPPAYRSRDTAHAQWTFGLKHGQMQVWKFISP